MNFINKTFQQSEFNFWMLKPVINSSKDGLRKIVHNDLVLKELQSVGASISKLNSEADAALLTALTKCYIQKLITSLDRLCVPDHDILTLTLSALLSMMHTW